MGRSIQNQSKPTECPLPTPLGEREWAAVVRGLSLAPQQERIVRLIMRAKSDKEISSEIGISLPTVRTYLKRVFERASVEDRMQLVHRVYANAIEAWSGPGSHRS